MKKKIATLSIMLASMAFGAGAQANFAFDHLQGESEYGQSKYRVYYDAYMDACGSYETLNQSSMFGEKGSYDKLYPRIGQLHAELEQVKGVKPGSRQHMQRTLVDAKKILDTGHLMRDVHEGQVGEMGKNTKLMGGDDYYRHAQARVKESHVHLDKSMKMKRDDAYSSIISRINSDGGTTREGEIIPSSYDRWQECKSFWSYAERNWRQLRR